MSKSQNSAPLLHRYLPNLLTLLRLIAVPIIIVLILNDHLWASFALFALAGITDYIDGFLARRWQVESTFGRIADPMADKSLLMLSFMALGYKELLPLWIIILVISRDVLILLAALLVYFKSLPMKLSPIYSSKLNTTCQIVLVGGTLLTTVLQQPPLDLQESFISIISFLNGLMFAILWLTAITTVWSGVEYAIGFVKENSRST